MSHIHTGSGQHDHTASAFILRTDTAEPALMLHRHKKIGKFMQYGGHIELDETPWQAVSHEIFEESGYFLEDLKILQPKDGIEELTGSVIHPYPVCHETHRINADHLHTDVSYAFIAAAPPKAAIADTESADFIVVTRQELVALSDDDTFANIREIGTFIFDVCLPQWVKTKTSKFKL